MNYALITIWHERQRFLPAVFAVSFSAILIAVQAGLMLGLFSTVSVPIDKSRADVWVGYPGVRSVDLGRPIPDRWASRVAAEPEVERVEPCVVGFSLWVKVSSTEAPSTPEVITVVGARLDPGSLGAVEYLKNDDALRTKLSEPFTVAVDESEIARLGIKKIGDQAEVAGRLVRVVGFVKNYKSLGGPYVFCSLETARVLVRDPNGSSTYILAKCKNPEDAEKVAQRLGRYKQMSAFTSDDFSRRSRLHWLFTTKAGIAVGFTALLGLFVGSVVTSQTLYAATAAFQREFATMRAMGIPNWRLQITVIEQSFWVGLFGLIVAMPIAFGLAEVADWIGTRVWLHPGVLLITVIITMLMALGSGLLAVRSFRKVDPAHNIR